MRALFTLFATLGVASGLNMGTAGGATVSYSGVLAYLSETVLAPNCFVIAGTAAAGFDPLYDYLGKYNVAQNQDFDAFPQAVADGYIIPIGNGTLTDGQGVFSGSGETDAPPGTPIWLFAFGATEPVSVLQLVASSDSSAWRVPVQPAGSTILYAGFANIFLYGQQYGNGTFPNPFGPIGLDIVPFPEPATWSLFMIGCVAMVSFRKRCDD